MEQKVIQIGNSVGVVIPQPYIAQLDLKPGDKVLVKKTGNQVVVSKIKTNKKLVPGVDTEFAKKVDEFITEHEDVLKELSKR